MGIIPARKAIAISVATGQSLTVTNTHGKQVVDFWAFDPADQNGYLSMIHTRTILGKLSLAEGDVLYSTRRQPVLTLIKDTTPGVHDMLWASCDVERYRMMGFDGYHDNCTDNLHKALEGSFPDFKISNDWVPDPLNLFMNVTIGEKNELDIQAPVSEKGQYVTMRAEKDLIVVMSCCPQDLAPTNAGMPTDCEFHIAN